VVLEPEEALGGGFGLRPGDDRRIGVEPVDDPPVGHDLAVAHQPAGGGLGHHRQGHLERRR
jgi:hypothetical protein